MPIKHKVKTYITSSSLLAVWSRIWTLLRKKEMILETTYSIGDNAEADQECDTKKLKENRRIRRYFGVENITLKAKQSRLSRYGHILGIFFSEPILVRTSLPICLCESDAGPPPLCLLLPSYETYL